MWSLNSPVYTILPNVIGQRPKVSLVRRELVSGVGIRLLFSSTLKLQDHLRDARSPFSNSLLSPGYLS
jgi:hypothetical protein